MLRCANRGCRATLPAAAASASAVLIPYFLLGFRALQRRNANPRKKGRPGYGRPKSREETPKEGNDTASEAQPCRTAKISRATDRKGSAKNAELPLRRRGAGGLEIGALCGQRVKRVSSARETRPPSKRGRSCERTAQVQGGNARNGLRWRSSNPRDRRICMPLFATSGNLRHSFTPCLW